MFSDLVICVDFRPVKCCWNEMCLSHAGSVDRRCQLQPGPSLLAANHSINNSVNNIPRPRPIQKTLADLEVDLMDADDENDQVTFWIWITSKLYYGSMLGGCNWLGERMSCSLWSTFCHVHHDHRFVIIQILLNIFDGLRTTWTLLLLPRSRRRYHFVPRVCRRLDADAASASPTANVNANAWVIGWRIPRLWSSNARNSGNSSARSVKPPETSLILKGRFDYPKKLLLCRFY